MPIVYGGAAPKANKPSYNPYAYVPGGSSQSVSTAIQNKGGGAQPYTPPSTSANAPSGSSQVPGYPTGVTNDNLAEVLFGSGGAGTTDNPAAGGSGGGSWPTVPQPKIPKFEDIVGLDPMVVGAQHNKVTQSALYDNMLQQLRQQMIVQLGEPEFADKLGFAIDPVTADLARQNTKSGFSQLGRINFNSSQAIKAVINQLAGNGMLFSGETGYQQGLNERQKAMNVYDAETGVQNQLTSALNDNIARKQALDDAIFQARQYAYNNYLNNPLSYATALGRA